MKIGGYQIINLKGKNLTTGVGMVYDDLYELIEGTRKPILLSGIQVDDVEYQDVFAELSVNGSNLELRAYGKVFTIQDNDVVIVSNDDSGEGDLEPKIVTITINGIGFNVYEDSVMNNILKIGNFTHKGSNWGDDGYYICYPIKSPNEFENIYCPTYSMGYPISMDSTPYTVRVFEMSQIHGDTLQYLYDVTEETPRAVQYEDVFRDGNRYELRITDNA